MNAPVALPDVALQQLSSINHAIDWVGMTGIAIPAMCQHTPVQLDLDISVNLPNPSAKGIHMSRLYQLTQTHLANTEITRESISNLLCAVIESHSDVGSTSARLRIQTHLLLKRSALISDLAGWKYYPLTLEAQLVSDKRNSNNQADLRMQVSVDYSSTCPCSAALSRQLLQAAFLAEFRQQDPTPNNIDTIGEWLAHHGSLATPHSQRSQALISLSLNENDLPIIDVIDAIEAALGTPVQTAVKRVDEQAFAQLNGENLMYVEDAVRRLQAALHPRFSGVSIQVIHRESLHQHDAVASIHNPIPAQV